MYLYYIAQQYVQIVQYTRPTVYILHKYYDIIDYYSVLLIIHGLARPRPIAFINLIYTFLRGSVNGNWDTISACMT